MSDLKEFPLHDVHVLRGKDVVTVEVPKHEVRVLKAVHGPERVTDNGEIKDETIELDPDLATEVDRLRRKYRQANTPDAVDVAYPNGVGLEGFGLVEGSTEAAKAPRSAVKKHAKPAKGGKK